MNAAHAAMAEKDLRVDNLFNLVGHRDFNDLLHGVRHLDFLTHTLLNRHGHLHNLLNNLFNGHGDVDLLHNVIWNGDVAGWVGGWGHKRTHEMPETKDLYAYTKRNASLPCTRHGLPFFKDSFQRLCAIVQGQTLFSLRSLV